MLRLGVREIVPLVLFLVAIGVSATFLDPAKTSGNVGPRPAAPGYGTPVASTPTTAAGMATGVAPLRPMPAPEKWSIAFVEVLPAGGERIAYRFDSPEVNFAYEGSPSPGIRDDAWRLVAEAQVELPEAGRYFLVIEHDAEVRVFIDGRETAYQVAGDGVRQVTVTFSHGPGVAAVRVEGTDGGGAFLLRIR
jgi:hypothetical protein